MTNFWEQILFFEIKGNNALLCAETPCKYIFINVKVVYIALIIENVFVPSHRESFYNYEFQLLLMTVFDGIPHVERRKYRRTTMNEEVLFFTFNPILLQEMEEKITSLALDLGMQQLPQTKNEENMLAFIDDGIYVSFLNYGIFVNIPTSKYRDFDTTDKVWTHLSKIMSDLNLNPMVWTFTKGNRLVFTKQLDEKTKNSVSEVVFSKEALEKMGTERIYVEESKDKMRTVTCRYGFDMFKDRTALNMKTMITTQSYSPENLLSEVKETNNLMFSVWFWAVNDRLKEVMDKE